MYYRFDTKHKAVDSLIKLWIINTVVNFDVRLPANQTGLEALKIQTLCMRSKQNYERSMIAGPWFSYFLPEKKKYVHSSGVQ
jgi:hypothetical protein